MVVSAYPTERDVMLLDEDNLIMVEHSNFIDDQIVRSTIYKMANHPYLLSVTS